MTHPSCVFCKIITGEIPSMKVYEDEGAFAFLDIGPLAEGHLLIVPKSHYERLDEMKPDEVAAVTRHLPRLAKAVMSATGTTDYNLLQNNGNAAQQSVDHVHFHIIPRREADAIGYRWVVTKYSAGRGEELQKKVVAALNAVDR